MFFRDAKVLITGSAGLVGSHLMEALVRRGASVRAAFRHRRPPLLQGVEYWMGADLTNRTTCDQLVQGIEYVFHCAASTSGAAAITSTPLVHVTPNLLINSQLFEAAYLAGVRKLLYLSSTTGYPPTGKPYREDQMFTGDPFEKYFAAGWMKRYTEILCRMYSEKLDRRMPCVVLRPTSIYGPGDKFDPLRSHVLPALIRKVVERQDPLVVWGTGDDIRDFLYVDDMVDAMLLALEKIEGYEPLNVGLGKSYTVKELLQMLLELEGFKDAHVVFDASKPSTVPTQRVDCSKAERVLGFKARIDLPEGLARTTAWYKAQWNPTATSSACEHFCR